MYYCVLLSNQSRPMDAPADGVRVAARDQLSLRDGDDYDVVVLLIGENGEEQPSRRGQVCV